MEAGHFAGDQVVLGAERQLAAERTQARIFEGYVDLTRSVIAEGGRWLDIGCGAGLLLQKAAQAGFRTEGIELASARRAVAETLTGATIYDRPIEDLAFPDETFDVVSLINVFSHLVSPTRTLNEIRRILTPGGVVLMVTGELGDGVRKSHVFEWSLGDHLYFLGESTMERYAAKIGLGIIHRDRVWEPHRLYTAERFRTMGRSRSRNLIKLAVVNTPGALRLLRAVMLRRGRDNDAYTSELLLRK